MNLLSCPVCFGDPSSPMTQSAKWGVLFLLVVVVCVLAGIASVAAVMHVTSPMLLPAWSALLAQEAGTIAGRVTAAGSQESLPGAQITVVGSGRIAHHGIDLRRLGYRQFRPRIEP